MQHVVAVAVNAPTVQTNADVRCSNRMPPIKWYVHHPPLPSYIVKCRAVVTPPSSQCDLAECQWRKVWAVSLGTLLLVAPVIGESAVMFGAMNDLTG